MSRVQGREGSSKTQSSIGPLKWMAPECISDRTYSQKTDVWAYGITLVEIYTREDPYPNLDSLYVATRVMLGKLKPEVPTFVPSHVKVIMESCFAVQPQDRPSFEMICEKLSNA